jgi:hypothetical protein
VNRTASDAAAFDPAVFEGKEMFGEDHEEQADASDEEEPGSNDD